MQLCNRGEFNIIADINRIINNKSVRRSQSWHRLLSGIGDDTAVWKTRNEIVLATTDSLVENIHFDLRYSSWQDIGWKMLAINISDIAAMGGLPDYSLISLALPGSLEISSIYNLYEGAIEIANKFGVAICGGNISASSQVVLSVSIIGHATKRRVLQRTGAIPGDCIAVTGYPGLSAAGLRSLQSDITLPDVDREIITVAHLRPEPKIEIGQTLINCGVRSAIDISDGLLADLGHICTDSGTGARIYPSQLPVHPLIKSIFGADSLQMILCGGEDYGLLFTASSAVMNKVMKQLNHQITIIGEVTKENPGRVMLIGANGEALPGYEKTGWDHFTNVDAD